jgi:hypothetical protein
VPELQVALAPQDVHHLFLGLPAAGLVQVEQRAIGIAVLELVLTLESILRISHLTEMDG